MTRPENEDSATASALLELVAADQQARTGVILEQAEEWTAAVVDRARREAHRRVRQAIQENRERTRRLLKEARADLATRERRLERESNLLLLERGWPLLEKLLRERWNTPESRCEWVSGFVAEALKLLPRVPWRIQHPPNWNPAELGELAQDIAQKTGAAPTWEQHSEIHCGLRAVAGDVQLDSTTNGLLANPSEVRGRLLAELVGEEEPAMKDSES